MEQTHSEDSFLDHVWPNESAEVRDQDAPMAEVMRQRGGDGIRVEDTFVGCMRGGGGGLRRLRTSCFLGRHY